MSVEFNIKIEKKHLLIFIIGISALMGINYAIAASSTSSPNPGHPASEIGAASQGTWQTFAEGNYKFPGNLKAKTGGKFYALLTNNCTLIVAQSTGDDVTKSCPKGTRLVSMGAFPRSSFDPYEGTKSKAGDADQYPGQTQN